VFVDEKKLTLFHTNDDGVARNVKRERGEELLPECTVPTIKHGGGNIKFWASFSHEGPGELKIIEEKMTGELYKTVLNENLWITVNNMNLEEEYYLLQDNDPKHTSKVVQGFLKTMDVEQVTKFPPNSPDLNPIENLWPTHAKRVYARNPRNLQELKRYAIEEWKNLIEELPFLQKLANSMPDRIQAVLDANGWYTKY